MTAKIEYKGETLATVKNGTKTMTTAGKYMEDDVAITDSIDLQTKTKTYTPSETQQTETITADAGKDGLDEVGVTVGAISSTYVGTGITRRSSTDLSASGATVTAPAGYYENPASKAVASGTAGTPTATKGTVSGHAVSVTPRVTNTTGYITGGTKTGTAVSVSASELVSGTKSITANDTGIDVTNYAAVDVNVAAGSNDFIVTVAWDAVEQMYVPDCTYQEVADAYADGKDIIVGSYDDENAITGGYEDDTLWYQIDVFGAGTLTTAYYYDEGNGLVLDFELPFYDPQDMTATAGEVASGSTFITSTGPETGTATRRTSADLSASGDTVTAPAGYYANAATYPMEYGSATAPATISGSSASVSTGTNTITLSKTISVTPTVSAGYVSSGTAGNSAVSLTGSVTTKGATTYPASTSDQTIASGTYLTGTQTIKGYAVQAKEFTANGTYTPDSGFNGFHTVTVNVAGGGGSVQTDTKTATASNYPTSLSFTSMKGEPKMFTVRLNAQVSSSGSTTYYYIVDITSHGTTVHGNCFRIGSTRRVDNITSGYSWSYSGTTLTITSSAGSRSASPGAFYNGSYELLYVY